MADDLFELLLILILLSITVLPIVSIVFGIKLKKRNQILSDKESQLREIKEIIYKIYQEGQISSDVVYAILKERPEKILLQSSTPKEAPSKVDEVSEKVTVVNGQNALVSEIQNESSANAEMAASEVSAETCQKSSNNAEMAASEVSGEAQVALADSHGETLTVALEKTCESDGVPSANTGQESHDAGEKEVASTQGVHAEVSESGESEITETCVAETKPLVDAPQTVATAVAATQEVHAETSESGEAESGDSEITETRVAETKPLVDAPQTVATAVVSSAPQISISLILAIGVALVCVAGIAFVISNWNEMSSFGKLASISGSAIIFYSAFALAKHYSLRHSSAAFYIIGSFALGITVFAAEVLEILPFGTRGAPLVAFPVATFGIACYIGRRFSSYAIFIIFSMVSAWITLVAINWWVIEAVSPSYVSLSFVMPTVLSVVGFGVALSRTEMLSHETTKIAGWITAFSTLCLVVSSMKSGHAPVENAVFCASYFALLGCSVWSAFRYKKYPIDILVAIAGSLFVWYIYETFETTSQSMALDTLTSLLCAVLIAVLAAIYKKQDKCLWATLSLSIVSIFIYLFILKNMNDALIALPGLTMMALFPRQKLPASIPMSVFGTSMALVAYGAYSVGVTEWRCAIASLLMLGVALAMAFVPEKYYPQKTLRRVVSTCFLLISSIIITSLSFYTGMSEAYGLLLAAVLATSASAIMLLESRNHQIMPGQISLMLIGHVMAYIAIAFFTEGILALCEKHIDQFYAVESRVYVYLWLLYSCGVLAWTLYKTTGKGKITPHISLALILNALSGVLYLCLAHFDNYKASRSFDMSFGVQLVMALLLIAVSVGTSFMLCRKKSIRHDYVPAFMMFCGLLYLVNQAFAYYDDGSYYRWKWVSWLIVSVVMAVYAFFVSRPMRGITGNRLMWVLPALMLVFIDHDPYHFIRTLGILLISLNLLQYFNDHGRSLHDRWLITAAVALPSIGGAIRLVVRSSFVPDIIVPECAVMCLALPAYILAWFLWRWHNVAHSIAYWIFAIGVLLLCFMEESLLFHACFVTVIAVVSILLGLRMKRMRYLASGLVPILVIFFRSTSNFWLELSWWVYLLMIGLILVGIAVANEASRRRGTTLAKALQEKREKLWQW